MDIVLGGDIPATCYADQVKRMDQLTGQYKTSCIPNPKFVLIHYVINAGPFFSLGPNMLRMLNIHVSVLSL